MSNNYEVRSGPSRLSEILNKFENGALRFKGDGSYEDVSTESSDDEQQQKVGGVVNPVESGLTETSLNEVPVNSDSTGLGDVVENNSLSLEESLSTTQQSHIDHIQDYNREEEMNNCDNLHPTESKTYTKNYGRKTMIILGFIGFGFAFLKYIKKK